MPAFVRRRLEPRMTVAVAAVAERAVVAKVRVVSGRRMERTGVDRRPKKGRVKGFVPRRQPQPGQPPREEHRQGKAEERERRAHHATRGAGRYR